MGFVENYSPSFFTLFRSILHLGCNLASLSPPQEIPRQGSLLK